MSFDVPFIRPQFPAAKELSADFSEIVEANWYTNFGPKERAFSAALAAKMGDGYHVVTFANATIALLAALQVKLGRGDGHRRVLVPSFTFAAGPQAIEWCGYVPLFVDIDAATLQPSLHDARKVLSEPGQDIAAILLCNTFGIGNGSIAEWEDLADEAGVPLIIDSAAGFGSTYPDGSPVGTAGTCEVLSFHATKPFAIGEGGAIVTRDLELATALTEFTNFGFHAAQGATALGLNGKLHEFGAAIGLRQLVGFSESIAARQSVVARYMSSLPATFIFPERIEESSVCFATMLLPDRETRDAAKERLLARSVEARTYYSPPVHAQPHFAGAQSVAGLDVTMEVVGRVLSVPVYARMAEHEIHLIIDTLAQGGDA
ncbi:DegT/DnrJ/EryC1/StrS family aminotransferase [soil metagenome]